MTGEQRGYKMTQAWPPGQWNAECQMLEAPTSSDALVNFNLPDPRFSNWSWHVALRLSSQDGSPNKDIVVVVGYNGRTDQCWSNIDIDYRKRLDEVWADVQYFGSTNRAVQDGKLLVHIDLLSLDSHTPFPKAITPGYDGKPFLAKIQFY